MLSWITHGRQLSEMQWKIIPPRRGPERILLGMRLDNYNTYMERMVTTPGVGDPMSFWNTKRLYQCKKCWKTYMAHPTNCGCPWCHDAW